MAITPNSIATPQAIKSGTSVVVGANTTYTDAPTNAGLLITAGANGARVTRITVSPRADASLGNLQLYRSLDAGTTKRFFKSVLQAAHTFATTTAIPVIDFGYSDDNPLTLAPNELVYCAMSVALASGNVFTAEWADY